MTKPTPEGKKKGRKETILETCGGILLAGALYCTLLSIFGDTFLPTPYVTSEEDEGKLATMKLN
jgi:hypothetical protein